MRIAFLRFFNCYCFSLSLSLFCAWTGLQNVKGLKMKLQDIEHLIWNLNVWLVGFWLYAVLLTMLVMNSLMEVLSLRGVCALFCTYMFQILSFNSRI